MTLNALSSRAWTWNFPFQHLWSIWRWCYNQQRWRKRRKKKHHWKTELSRGCVFGIKPVWMVFPIERFVADPLPLRNSPVTLRAGHHITHPEGFHSKAHDTGNRKGEMHILGRHLLWVKDYHFKQTANKEMSVTANRLQCLLQGLHQNICLHYRFGKALRKRECVHMLSSHRKTYRRTLESSIM